MRVRISRKWWISFVATLGLLTLVWAVGSAVARGSDEGSPIGPTGGFSATHTFTYQGRLLDGGQPANGYYDFIVTLWTSETVGTQIAACEDWTNPLNSHYVEDGIFTFHLQPTNAATRLEVFNGENRWIQVQVRPYDPLDVEPYTTLPRQPIAAAPYAFSLYPQAVISGTVEGEEFGQAVLNIRAWHPWGGGPYATALYAQSNTSSAVRAVSGGTGVHAQSTFQYAVRGDVITGTGGFFTSDAGYGVYAESSGTEPWDYGGYFTADWGYGVYAVSEENMALRAEAGDVSGLMRPAGQWGAVGIGESGGVWGSSGDGVAIRGASDSGNLIELHDSSPPMPDRRFYVSNAGNVYADGYYYGAGGVFAGSADFAEMMRPSEADLEPGDVLAIGPDGRMVRSSEPCQTTVVGVYSTAPGFVAGNKLDEEGNPLEPERIPLAVVGVVPVKASAENGPIQPGDMLTASSIPGHAMRAGPDPAVGTVIGKALEPLGGGTGVIQMLVMLQ